MDDKDVLISGGGIAGLTLAILLKERGFEPLVIERAPALRTEGYMMDFFGTGWDVAERMGLIDDINKLPRPIDTLAYIDRRGSPRFPPVPIDRIRRALDGKYAYLRRPDLERILFDRATAAEVPVKFGTEIEWIHEGSSDVEVRFSDGTAGEFALLFGADGVHSRVRELAFGKESQFARFLGYYVAAFHFNRGKYDTGRSVNMYEEPCRICWAYPIGQDRMESGYAFCHDDIGHIPREERLRFVKEQIRGMGWIAEELLRERDDDPLYFDSATQIVMPSWHTNRIALLGDACGCLTLLAGQGSHMAMAGAYVLARELEKHRGYHIEALSAYENFLKPHVGKKQDEAARTAKEFVPHSRFEMLYRYPLMRIAFSGFFVRKLFAGFGAKSILAGYR
ncbi:MAG TPA: FAD-dependent monooxygenase [Methanoregulaceae archaeon]|nr:FAD-dependent monooxygenase [Methanoregulaceae archaeon]